MLYLKIAWRSLLRHKGKSIIIGTILFLASFIMILGDATAIGMRRGVEKNIVESFTGHIILVSNEEPKDNVLFTPMAKPLKILKDWEKIKWTLSQQDWIKDFIPMTRGGVAILGGQQMSFMLTFGCDFDDFQRMFGNPVKAVEGSLLTGNDHGMMVNVDNRKNLYKFQRCARDRCSRRWRIHRLRRRGFGGPGRGRRIHRGGIHGVMRLHLPPHVDAVADSRGEQSGDREIEGAPRVVFDFLHVEHGPRGVAHFGLFGSGR